MAWLPTYLLKERGMSLMNMGLFAAISGFGNFLGFLGGGWASDRIWGGRRKPMMFFAAIALAVTMYCLANVPNSQAILGVLLFFSGMLGSSAMSVYTSYPMGLTTSKAYPTAVGVVVTGGALGGFFSPVLAGMLLDHFKYFSIVFGFFGLTALMTFVVALTLVEPLENRIERAGLLGSRTRAVKATFVQIHTGDTRVGFDWPAVKGIIAYLPVKTLGEWVDSNRAAAEPAGTVALLRKLEVSEEEGSNGREGRNRPLRSAESMGGSRSHTLEGHLCAGGRSCGEEDRPLRKQQARGPKDDDGAGAENEGEVSLIGDQQVQRRGNLPGPPDRRQG